MKAVSFQLHESLAELFGAWDDEDKTVFGGEGGGRAQPHEGLEELAVVGVWQVPLRRLREAVDDVHFVLP